MNTPGHSICWCTCTARAVRPGSWALQNSSETHIRLVYICVLSLYVSILRALRCGCTHPGQFSQSRVHLLVTGWDGLPDVSIVPAAMAITINFTSMTLIKILALHIDNFIPKCRMQNYNWVKLKSHCLIETDREYILTSFNEMWAHRSTICLYRGMSLAYSSLLMGESCWKA